MALHYTTQVNFDVADGSSDPSTPDANGVVHLPYIKQGSELVFQITPQFPAAGGPVTITGYTFRVAFRGNDHDGAVEMSGDTAGLQILEIDATTLEVRFTGAEVAALVSESGLWDLEVIYNDGTTADAVDRIAEGSYQLYREVTR
jgi:hypothetical protein